jgi:hypothetical protein
VNTQTGEAMSEVFKKREPAREIASRLYKEQGLPVGVRHLEEYVAETPEQSYVALLTFEGGRVETHTVRAKTNAGAKKALRYLAMRFAAEGKRVTRITFE